MLLLVLVPAFDSELPIKIVFFFKFANATFTAVSPLINRNSGSTLDAIAVVEEVGISAEATFKLDAIFVPLELLNSKTFAPPQKVRLLLLVPLGLFLVAMLLF